MSAAFYSPAWHELQLPWHVADGEDKKFRRILRACLIAMAALGVIVPMVPLPEIERAEQETLPPQLARIVLERKQLAAPVPKVKPLPKPVVQQDRPKPRAEKTEPIKPPPVTPKPEPKTAPVRAKAPPKATPDTVARVVKAREKAAASGLLQFKDELAAMRDEIDVAKLAADTHAQGQSTANKIDRSVLTGRAGKKSGGIQVAALSRDTGGVALSGRESTKVSSALAMAKARPQRGNSGVTSSAVGRSDQDIRKIMDRNKGAIFSIYNRALRKNPALAGKMTIQMVIDPSGKVSSIKLIANELSDPALEKKLMARIRMIDFGAQPVAATTLNYSFDFLPY